MKSCVSVKWNWLFSKEQPGCSGGSRVALAYPHTVWQHRTVLLSFSSTGLFALSFPPLNHTNLILVLFSYKFFTVMSTSIALVSIDIHSHRLPLQAHLWAPYSRGEMSCSSSGPKCNNCRPLGIRVRVCFDQSYWKELKFCIL